MANTYSQIYLHLIFAIKNRVSYIMPEDEKELYPYISTICQKRKHHLHAIGGTRNHLHLLVGVNPRESVSELVRHIKIASSMWMHARGCRFFEWQTGYGVFSYSKSQLPQVEHYILNQKTHHQRMTFGEEIREIMHKSGMDYDDDYLLQDIME